MCWCNNFDTPSCDSAGVSTTTVYLSDSCEKVQLEWMIVVLVRLRQKSRAQALVCLAELDELEQKYRACVLLQLTQFSQANQSSG